MESSLLVVAAGVSGYWVLFQTNGLRHLLARQHGGHLFYQSVGFGLLLFLASRMLAGGIDWCCPALAPHLDGFLGVHHSTTLLVLLMVAALLPVVINKFCWTDEKIARAPSLSRGDAIERVLQEGIANSAPIEVTTRGGTVYVGFVVDTGIPSPHLPSYIGLLPLAAGRCAGSLSPEYVENWAALLRDQRVREGHWSPEKWVITFPKDDVLIIRHFDLSLFAVASPVAGAPVAGAHGA